VTDRPLIVDGDTGLDAAQFEYTCARLEMVGVSPSSSRTRSSPSATAGCRAGKTLEAPDVFATKIRRGKQVQITDDFLIIARLESLIATRASATPWSGPKPICGRAPDGL